MPGAYFSVCLLSVNGECPRLSNDGRNDYLRQVIRRDWIVSHRLVFVYCLSCMLIFCGSVSRESYGLSVENEEETDTQFFDDEILDAMEGRSIGVDLVPLSQVRQEVLDGKPTLDDEDLQLTLEALHDIESKGEESFEPTHPLVPRGAKPCTGEGLVVSSIVTHGPAYDAGIRRGDVIYLINGKKVTSVEEFEAALEKEGKKVTSNGMKVGVAAFNSNRRAGISATSPQAWKRQVVTVNPRLTRYVLLDPLKRTPDAIKMNDLFSHKLASAKQSPISMRLYFFRTISRKPDSLLLTVQYHGKSWIFTDRLTVRADDEVLEFEVPRAERRQDINDDGSVDETVSYHCKKEEEKKLLKAILTAKKVVVRASGAKGLEECEIELSERARMEELFNIYKKLGGEAGS